MSTDVAFVGDRNVIKKKAEKILKYKDLTIEIQPMWDVKEKVLPVIIDWNNFNITETVCEQHTRTARKQGTAKIKTAVVGTVHVLGKVLM